MSNNQKLELLERYRAMSTEELVVISGKGTLTEVASEAMNTVLIERKISPEDIESIKNDIDLEDCPRERNLASLSSRLLAQILDNLIAIFFGTLFYFIGSESVGAFIIGYLGYNLLSDGLPKGQSFGKKILNIAVVDVKNDKPCSYFMSIIRNLFLLILGLIDILFIFRKSRQRLGDMAVGTKVVNIDPLKNK